MRISCKQTIALLLTLVLLLTLCACAQERQTEPEKAINNTAGDVPQTKTGGRMPDKLPEEPAPRGEEWSAQPARQTFSPEAETALGFLRDRIDFPATMFGAAYLGYVGGLFEEGFAAGFPAWLRETNEAMLGRYPFIAEIDENHIAGGAGHLYCIVPVDENATVSINRMLWNDEKQINEISEVLYRSETGEPVLLFANLDGMAYVSDTQVLITDNSGNTCEWYPAVDAASYDGAISCGQIRPCLSEAGDNVLFDFTEYAWQNAPQYLAPWLADGWSGMTALGLAGSQSTGTGWYTHTMAGETGAYADFSLRFYPGGETGGAVELNWTYEAADDFEEMWSGFWTMETVLDGPSYVTVSLSLVGGVSYGVTDGPYYLCETYPLLISPSGEELLIGAGEIGICLPFMSQSTTACVLMQAAG